MTSYLRENIELVGDILEERFGKKSKLFNDPITTLQICQHIIRVSINRSGYLDPEKQNALRVGKSIFQALNLYSSDHQQAAREQVENVIHTIEKNQPSIKWPTAIKKSYLKFTNNFPLAFEKNDQVRALKLIEDFTTVLKEDKDNVNVFVLKDLVQDLTTAAEAWELGKVEQGFYSVVDYYFVDESEVRPSLVTT